MNAGTMALGITVAGVDAERACGNKPVSVDMTQCVHCGLCTGVCVSGALRIDSPTWELAYLPGRCNGCRRCLETCPLGAISNGRS